MKIDILPTVRKITIIGNVASGKTELARRLSKRLDIPVTHIDGVQFDQNLNIGDLDRTRTILKKVQEQEAWIIDGQGPLDMFEKRFTQANLIIFIDLPIYLNFMLLTYRLLKNIFSPRKELPVGSKELSWAHIKKQYRTTWVIHKKMRSELIRMLNRNEFRSKVVTVTQLGVY